MTPAETVTRSRIRPAPAPNAPVHGDAAHGNGAANIFCLRHRQVLERIEVAQQVSREANGVLAHVGIGGVRTRCRDLEDEAQRTLLPNRIVLGVDGSPFSMQSPRNSSENMSISHFATPGTAGLLIRDAGQFSLPFSLSRSRWR